MNYKVGISFPIICKVLIISFFLFMHKGFGQVLSGKIVSEQKPIAFASVGIPALKIGTVADSSGNFSLKLPGPGTFKILISALGYQTYHKTIGFSADEQKALTLELDKSETALDEVVVTGTLKPINRSQSIIPIEVINPKLFLKNQSTNIFEGLNMVNGVRPQLNCNVCNTGDIHINGMEGAYTMVMIDGMPMVSALGTVYGLMGIPNGLIQRIEIQKGPASSLYGSEAVGGLINIITKSAASAPKFSFDVFTTSYAEHNADFTFKTNLGKKVSALISANVFNFSNRVDKNRDNFTDVPLQSRVSLFNKFSIERRSKKAFSIATRLFYEDRFGGEMGWKRENRAGNQVYGESIFTSRGEVFGNYVLPGKEDINLQFSGNYHNQNSAYGNTLYKAVQSIGFFQAVWNKKVSKSTNFLAGAAIRYTYYDDNTLVTAKADSLNAGNLPSKTFLPGIFLQVDHAFSVRHSILGGIRQDYHPKHGPILSPRINYLYKISPFQSIRFGLGNGFRVVNVFSEDHAAYSGTRKVEIQKDLSPEKSWNTNLNYTKTIFFAAGSINFDVNVFYTRFSNRIVADYFTDTRKVIFSNSKGFGINRGAGANIDFLFNFPLKLSLNATYSDVYLYNDETAGPNSKIRQVQTPPFTGNFLCSYTFSKTQTTFDFSGNAYSSMLLPTLPNDFRPSHSPFFTILNFQVTKVIGKSFQVYCGIKNILNFIPKNPIMRPFDPFDKNVNDPVNNPNGYTFDPNYNYAPLQGIRPFVGLRASF